MFGKILDNHLKNKTNEFAFSLWIGNEFLTLLIYILDPNAMDHVQE